MLDETQSQIFYSAMNALGCTPSALKEKIYEQTEAGQTHEQLTKEFVQGCATNTLNDMISNGDAPVGSTVTISLLHDYIITYQYQIP